jgi:hypothetical protein
MRLLAAFYRILNRFIPWYHLPFRFLPQLSLRLWNLPALRYDLRKHNLRDTSSLPTIPEPPGYTPPTAPGRQLPNPFTPPQPFTRDDLVYRRADGSYNDLHNPNMGRLGARYGRNFPLEESAPVVWRQNEKRFCPVSHNTDIENERPTAREISNALMARTSFRAAESLNLLVR